MPVLIVNVPKLSFKFQVSLVSSSIAIWSIMILASIHPYSHNQPQLFPLSLPPESVFHIKCF